MNRDVWRSAQQRLRSNSESLFATYKPCTPAADYRNRSGSDAQCGGENHGTGAVITVMHDEGGIPRATGLDIAANMEKAEAFEATAEELRADIYARYPEIAAKRRGEWISKWNSYLDGCSFLSDIRRAGNLKTHAGRMKRLEKIGNRFRSYQKEVSA